MVASPLLAGSGAGVPVDPEVEEKADLVVSPRPASGFATLAKRSEQHNRLYREGLKANSEGDIEVAIQRFVDAYALLFKRSTLFSLVNMLLKRGDCELAVACYRKMVKSVSGSEKFKMMAKLQEAEVQWAALREIVEPVRQPGLFNSAEDREKKAHKLYEKALAANSKGGAAREREKRAGRQS
eukprot:1619430-Prymnesium_polylepis.1